MFVEARAAAAGVIFLGVTASGCGLAAAQSQDVLRERFREECRAQFPQLSGPAHKEERFEKVSACVRAKFAARTRDIGRQAAAVAASTRSELKLVETTPWLTAEKRGPAETKGIVYFVRGGGTKVDAFVPVPYFIKTLSGQGWDTIAAKVPQGIQANSVETLGPVAAFVRRRVGELKAQGYKRVVLAGHSSGAWSALLAAQSPDFGADALLLSAPSVFGQRGHPNFGMNLSELPAALNRVKTPILIIFPDDTVYEPDPVRRAAMVEKHFADAKIAHLVIAKPSGFTGHLAAWLPIFDYAFGRCIAAFIENPSSSPCAPPPLSNADFRSIIGLDQVVKAESKTIASAEPLVGKKFLAYTLSARVTQHYEYASTTQRKHMEGTGVKGEAVSFRKDLHCIGSQCTKLVQWSDGQILEFDAKDGRLVGWWLERR